MVTKRTKPASTAKRKAARSPRTPRAGGAASEQHELARATLQNFRVVFNSVKRHFREVEARCGVSGAQLWALAAIAGSNGLRVTELAKAMAVHQSTASNLVGDLEKEGLVRKERGSDQRVVRLYLSEKGAQVMARAPKPMIGLLPEALEKLPKSALADLNASLELLIETMGLKDLRAAKTPLSDNFSRD